MYVVILVNIKLVISALFQDIIQGRPCFYIMGKGDKLRDSICKGGGLVLCSIINTYEQTHTHTHTHRKRELYAEREREIKKEREREKERERARERKRKK